MTEDDSAKENWTPCASGESPGAKENWTPCTLWNSPGAKEDWPPCASGESPGAKENWTPCTPWNSPERVDDQNVPGVLELLNYVNNFKAKLTSSYEFDSDAHDCQNAYESHAFAYGARRCISGSDATTKREILDAFYHQFTSHQSSTEIPHRNLHSQLRLGVGIFFDPWPCSVMMEKGVGRIIDALQTRQQQSEEIRQQQRSSTDRLLQGVAYFWAYYLPLPEDMKQRLQQVYATTFSEDDRDDAQLVERTVFKQAMLGSRKTRCEFSAEYQNYLPFLIISASNMSRWSDMARRNLQWTKQRLSDGQSVVDPSFLESEDFHEAWWMRSVYLDLISNSRVPIRYRFQSVREWLGNAYEQRQLASSKNHVPQTPCDILDTFILWELGGQVDQNCVEDFKTWDRKTRGYSITNAPPFKYSEKKENWLSHMKKQVQALRTVFECLLEHPENYDLLTFTATLEVLMYYQLYREDRNGEAESVMRQFEDLWWQIVMQRKQFEEDNKRTPTTGRGRSQRMLSAQPGQPLASTYATIAKKDAPIEEVNPIWTTPPAAAKGRGRGRSQRMLSAQPGQPQR